MFFQWHIQQLDLRFANKLAIYVVLILSPDHGGKPISWNSNFCWRIVCFKLSPEGSTIVTVVTTTVSLLVVSVSFTEIKCNSVITTLCLYYWKDL